MPILISTFTGFVWCGEVFSHQGAGQAHPSRLVETHPEEGRPGWFVAFSFNQIDWDEIPAEEAHELHELGHHLHDKTREDFYTLSLGLLPIDGLKLAVNLPYVSREFIEIEDHDRLGEEGHSEGLGDLTLTGEKEIAEWDNAHLSVLLGVKLPTGSTDEEGAGSELLSMDLQPGTGSTDVIFGVIFERGLGWAAFGAEAAYLLKTEGDRGFEEGDAVNLSFFISKEFSLNETSSVSVGAAVEYEYEGDEKEEGVTNPDHGGHTLLVGPSLTLSAGKNILLFGSILFPALQELNGEAQELDWTWTAGAKIHW